MTITGSRDYPAVTMLSFWIALFPHFQSEKNALNLKQTFLSWRKQEITFDRAKSEKLLSSTPPSGGNGARGVNRVRSMIVRTMKPLKMTARRKQ